MNLPNVRWKQRLSSFSRALRHLESAVDLHRVRTLSDLEKQGLIQAFEFTYELAWKLIKDYLIFQGAAADITGSRDAFREGFQKGLISDGALWMEMIVSRNKASHTYDESAMEEIVEQVIKAYLPQYLQLEIKMNVLALK